MKASVEASATSMEASIAFTEAFMEDIEAPTEKQNPESFHGFEIFHESTSADF